MFVPFRTSHIPLVVTTGVRETTWCRTCTPFQAGWAERMMYRVEENLVTFWHQFLLQFPASKQILERLNGANALTFCHGTFMKLFSRRLLSRSVGNGEFLPYRGNNRLKPVKKNLPVNFGKMQFLIKCFKMARNFGKFI